MIYFIRSGQYIKIGVSERPWERMASLQTAHPEPLEMLAIMPGAQPEERVLHARFASARADEATEWERERWRIQQADRTAVKLAQVAQQAASKQPASTVLASANGHGPVASATLYQCKQCASTFPSMQALGGHVRAAHKEAG